MGFRICFAFFVIVKIAMTKAAFPPVYASITFSDPNNTATPIPLVNAALSNTTGNLAFSTITNDTRYTIACAVGIWRFYPLPGFDYTFNTGLQIGYDQKFRCFDISTGRLQLANTKSYRTLGFIDGNSVNLNRETITLYTKEFGAGTASYFSAADFPTPKPILSSVKSFVITGMEDDTDLDSLENVAVFKSCWPNNCEANSTSLCFSLDKPLPAGGRSKMYFNQNMIYTEGGESTAIEMKGLAFHHGVAPEDFCPIKTGHVRSFNLPNYRFKELL